MKRDQPANQGKNSFKSNLLSSVYAGNLAKCFYQRRQSLSFDPFNNFMRHGAELWTRLIPEGSSFVFQKRYQEREQPSGETN